jgi:ABC transport system ATP-binding/permease protein
MAEPPILTLSDVAVTLGGAPLFEGVTLAIQPGDRLALVGRNGSGKSSLLRIIAGLAEPDRGERFLRPGMRVGYLAQEPDFAGHASLGAFAAAGFDPAETYRVDMALEGLKLDPAIAPEAASGGERRRAALARLLAHEPDVMLLDEPTNHLDIEGIEWLEGHVAASRAAAVIVSHDRAFLRALTRRTLWLDRGGMRQLDRGFGAFEAWRDTVWEEEDLARHKRDRLLAAEGRWAVEGISARRKRNQGRLRRLQAMRAERREETARAGTARMTFEGAAPSGRLVLEAQGIGKRYGERWVVRSFDLRVQRGERVAFVGPNGAGKTTLVKLLTGELPPDEGALRLGTNLAPAVFDQARAALDPEATLCETLGGRGTAPTDPLDVRGQSRLAVAYLKDFLFGEAQARGPVAALSGGERARLLLAKLMMRESNLLILDEPTNDLDVETLDLLEEIVADYAGTVLLVSHDRDFIDRIATATVACRGDGRWTVYAGGWTDHLAQRGAAAPEGDRQNPARPGPRKAPSPAEPATAPPKRLSFREAHRLEELPGEIERLTEEVGRLEGLLADPELYARDPGRFAKATEVLASRRDRLAAAEEEWLALEERREEAEG